ncbi:hypothetical protein EA772_15485 [Pedobacter sp. G11]|nr:hypothetical protein EA772_15485 [Pedobacter sp. G11]
MDDKFKWLIQLTRYEKAPIKKSQSSKDIHKNIAELNKQVKNLVKYFDGGGSLDIPSRPVENSTAMSLGYWLSKG